MGDGGGGGRRPSLVYAVVGVGVAVVFVAAALVVARRGGGKEDVATGSSTTAVTATTVAPTTVAQTTTSTTTRPATTATTVAAGTVLTAQGSVLAEAPQPTLQSTQPPTAGCTTLGDAGWTIECGVADLAGGQYVWLIEQQPATPVAAWRVRLVHWSQGKGAWLVDLRADSAAPGWTSVVVKPSDLDGDGKAELVFGYRNEGTGGYLSYDVVTGVAGGIPKVVAVRSGLQKGQASVAGGVITDYGADPNSPPANPAFFTKTVVSFGGDVYRAVPAGQVPPPGPGRLDL